jgi:hypothetical protein
MPPAGHEPKIPAIKQLQTHALDRMATEIGILNTYLLQISCTCTFHADIRTNGPAVLCMFVPLISLDLRYFHKLGTHFIPTALHVDTDNLSTAVPSYKPGLFFPSSLIGFVTPQNTNHQSQTIPSYCSNFQHGGCANILSDSETSATSSCLKCPR